MKFRRKRDKDKFTITMYRWIIPVKKYTFVKHYEGEMFLATSDKAFGAIMDGYTTPCYSYIGHNRKFYL